MTIAHRGCHLILCQDLYKPKCELRDVISTLVPLNLTHPNAPLLVSLLDLLGIDLAGLV